MYLSRTFKCAIKREFHFAYLFIQKSLRGRKPKKFLAGKGEKPNEDDNDDDRNRKE